MHSVLVFKMSQNKSKEGRLSKREKEILRLVLEDKSSNEISELLGISPRTTDTHRKNIGQKLGSSSVLHWMRWAFKNGLIE